MTGHSGPICSVRNFRNTRMVMKGEERHNSEPRWYRRARGFDAGREGVQSNINIEAFPGPRGDIVEMAEHVVPAVKLLFCC